MRIPQIKPSLILCFLLFLCLEAMSSGKTLIDFQEMDLTEASESGKKIMVSFTADWCLPCRVINSSIYNDPEIADLVNENFQPVMIDVDSSLGELWHQNYNVDFLPFILFTDPSGLEIERIKKTPTKNEFLRILRRIIGTSKVTYRTHNFSSIKISEIVGPEHAIQLGAFSTIASAKKRMSALALFREEEYRIIKEETRGKLLYKVIHEDLLSEEESISMIKNYHNNGFEAFLRRN